MKVGYKVERETGIEPVTFRVLRRTFATNAPGHGNAAGSTALCEK